VKDKKGSFLGLAYDVRKAYERQREVIQPPKHSEEIGVRYGVQILWPVLMLQQRLLRQSLAFLNHTAKTQAIAYALEAMGNAKSASNRTSQAMTASSGSFRRVSETTFVSNIKARCPDADDDFHG